MQQEQVDWFESWFGSPYYHILYQDRDMAEAAAFVDKLINHLNPAPKSRMADIACGEGRYAIQLAEKGFDVTGIDLSSSSIEIAKKHENEHLRFFVHDMRFPFYINYFDYVFNFFTSFGYFSSDRDHAMAAASFAKAVKKDGTLVIDYLNKEFVQKALVPEQTITRSGIEFHLKKELEHGHFIKNISFHDKEGIKRVYRESVAAFTRSDFISMFKKAGLELTESFGDYQLHAYDPPSSPRMIMVFKK